VPALTNGFGQCDGVPCYFDVVPGRTAWDAVRTRFSQRARIVTGDEITIDNRDVPNMMTLRRTRNGTTVGRVDLTFFNPGRATLGELVAVYGPPCKVFQYLDNPTFVWYSYPFLSVSAQSYSASDASFVDRRTKVFGMSLFVPSADYCKFGAAPETVVERPWRGFAILARYGFEQ
jgi:hypothetical protein